MSKTKKRNIVLVFCLALIAAISFSFIFSYNVHGETFQSELLYFVNCGEDSITSVEEGLNLKGTLGTGDQSYSVGGWGYVGEPTKIGSGSSDIFLSKTTGKYTYKFDLAKGEYVLSLGINSNIKYSVNGGQDVAIETSEKKVVAIPVQVEDANLTVNIDGETGFIAVTEKDKKVLLFAEATSTEVIEYGSVVNSKAKGFYSNGEIEDVKINYSNLSSAELNVNFSMAEAVGVVEGTNYSLPRKIISMPSNLSYFVNCGSETGSSNEIENDIYYSIFGAVKENFAGLKNETADQEYSNGNSWGYTPYYSSQERISSKQMPSKTGDPYPPPFPYNTIRCISGAPYGIEYTFDVEPGKYNIYVGTRSHWHSRSVKPYINDVEKGQFQLDATNRVNTFLNESDNNGKIKVRVTGNAGQDEGSIAYIAIQPATEVISNVPKAPSFEGSLQIGQTEFTVKDVTKNSKLQISLAESPYSVIYEETMASDGEHKVVLNEKLLNGVYKLRMTAVSNGGVSAYSEFFITDISDFVISADEENWTLSNVTLSVSAKTQNSFSRIEVTHNFFTEKYEISGKTYSGDFTAKQNGVYEFKIFSDTGAFFAQSYEVKNIDNTKASFGVALAESGWNDGKIPLKLNAVTNAEVTSFEIYNDKSLLSSDKKIPSLFTPDFGKYRLVFQSAVGKIAAVAVNVTQSPKGFNYAVNKTSDGKKIILSEKNARAIDKVFAYEIDGDSGVRLTVTGLEFEQYSSLNAGVLVLYKDGGYEATRLNTEIGKEGLSKGAIVGLSVGIPLSVIVLAAGGFLAFYFIRKKRGGKI